MTSSSRRRSGRHGSETTSRSIRQQPVLANSAAGSCCRSTCCCCHTSPQLNTIACCDQQLNWQTVGSLQQPVAASRQSGRGTCLMDGCELYSEHADELCSKCLMLLNVDDTNDVSNTGRRQQTAVKPQTLPAAARLSHKMARTPPPTGPAVDHSVTDPSVGSSRSSQSTLSPACIAPVCDNQGLDAYNGLCAACHFVLVGANCQQRQIPASYGTPTFVLLE